MNQMTNLFAAKKLQEYKEEKLFPTINLNCMKSLRCWIQRDIIGYTKLLYQFLPLIIWFQIRLPLF